MTGGNGQQRMTPIKLHTPRFSPILALPDDVLFPACDSIQSNRGGISLKLRISWRSLAFVSLSTAVLLLAVELVCRGYDRRQEALSDTTPGMYQFDSNLGWVLTPGWQGSNTHADFTAHYRIGADGFRVTPGARDAPEKPDILFLGDSFTFGIGVDDPEPFAAQLQRRRPELVIRNCSVPGYSTDQQCLLLDNLLGNGCTPRVVILVLCLVNDVDDNLHPYPMQANRPKPYFEKRGTNLVLRNHPVPVDAPPRNPSASFVPGAQYVPRWQHILARHSTAWRLLCSDRIRSPVGRHELEYAHRDGLELTATILRKIDSSCRKHNTELNVLLLPGQRYLRYPSSLSATRQDVLRKSLGARCREANIAVIDIAQFLEETREERRSSPWYFPRDGHLTRIGHEGVADLILKSLDRR